MPDSTTAFPSNPAGMEGVEGLTVDVAPHALLVDLLAHVPGGEVGVVVVGRVVGRLACPAFWNAATPLCIPIFGKRMVGKFESITVLSYIDRDNSI